MDQDKKQPIIIIGMARSGTTIVSHILGSLPNVQVEVEPHALWKSGNFQYDNDEEYDINERIVKRIRGKFEKALKGKTLVEKSPNNCLRPYLVHAVFPDAKIVYIERDPVRCIASNYKRSLSRDSFKLSIILKKYFSFTGSHDLPGAISTRKLHQQISLLDTPNFILYILKMFFLRNISKTLPFGPKIKNFSSIIKETNLLYYHVDVFKAALQYKAIFKHLYSDNMEVFKMEHVIHYPEEVKKLVEFVNLPYCHQWGAEIISSLDKERVINASAPGLLDEQIEHLLSISK